MFNPRVFYRLNEQKDLSEILEVGKSNSSYKIFSLSSVKTNEYEEKIESLILLHKTPFWKSAIR
jgi:hypothetical protein